MRDGGHFSTVASGRNSTCLHALSLRKGLELWTAISIPGLHVLS